MRLWQECKTLCKTELNSLHYIVGYCINAVKKGNTHCPSCLQAIETNQSFLTDPAIKLTLLKEYKENVLIALMIVCAYFKKQIIYS